MDRRRFVPSGEGLEGRALLSVVGGKTAASQVAQPIQGLPQNYQQKLQRIQNLPFFLNQIQPGRFLPSETIQGIQADLVAVTAKLHGVPTQVVDNFNVSLRHGFPRENLSKDTAQILDHTFGTVIAAAGVEPAMVQRFQANMNELARVDAAGIRSSYLAVSDYSLVLQTLLGVGRPIETPAAPTLSAKDGVKASGGNGGLTRHVSPTLVGVYSAGITPENSTAMQIIDENGNVLGSAPVENTGRYSVVLSPGLGEGTYKLHARAVDALGNLSKPSRVYQLRIVGPTIGAPAAQTASIGHPVGPLGPGTTR